MEQIVRNEFVSSGRRNHDLDHQIRRCRPVEQSPSPRHSRSASTRTNLTSSDSIFSTSPRTSYESLTSNSLSEYTWSALQQETPHDRRKPTRESRHTSNTCRRGEEIKGPSERYGGVIVSNRSVSHKGRFAGDRSRRKKAIVDHKDEEVGTCPTILIVLRMR